LPEFVHPLWISKCAKIPPTCPVMELSNEQQTSLPNWFILPLLLFGSHLDPLKHFLNFFCFNRCSLLGYFSKWTTFLHLFLSLAPHHVLGSGLGRYNKYVKRISFYVKESSFNRFWWKFY
jgi:hypothetical protein